MHGGAYFGNFTVAQKFSIAVLTHSQKKYSGYILTLCAIRPFPAISANASVRLNTIQTTCSILTAVVTTVIDFLTQKMQKLGHKQCTSQHLSRS